MKVIICLDERRGILFNHRRQSKDRRVIADIVSHLDGRSLYITPYSEKLFLESGISYTVDERMLEIAEAEDVCFAESADFLAHLDSVTQITVYWWNRHYPSDVRVDLDFDEAGYALKEQYEFEGFSHEKITVQRYER